MAQGISKGVIAKLKRREVKQPHVFIDAFNCVGCWVLGVGGTLEWQIPLGTLQCVSSQSRK